MGICAQELRLYVVRPTLKYLDCNNLFTENLLLGTAAVESGLGFHIKQYKQRSFGIYRMTSYTHRKLWDQYLMHSPSLASQIRGLASQHEFLEHPHAELTTNLRYATAMAYLVYLRANCPLSNKHGDDYQTMAECWYKAYRTRSKSKSQNYLQTFTRYITHRQYYAA